MREIPIHYDVHDRFEFGPCIFCVMEFGQRVMFGLSKVLMERQIDLCQVFFSWDYLRVTYRRICVGQLKQDSKSSIQARLLQLCAGKKHKYRN